ncbi:MAG: DPP IV N-terminal domain-containing protein, partial [Bacteroidota bacterium]
MKSSTKLHHHSAGIKQALILLISMIIGLTAFSQRGIKWAKQGSAYFRIEKNEIVKYTLPENTGKVIITKQQLTPQGASEPLKISFFNFSTDEEKLLIFTNTKKVWRINTRGDYWVLDTKTSSLIQLGKTLPGSSLMFTKFSPDSKSVAYVSGNNIYVEDLASQKIKALTTNGTVTLINGTFDWVYEEEFECRDGFRWSPDSKSIAYWQVDAGSTKKFYMIDNTDSIYSRPIPIEYPKVGEHPSPCRVGVVGVNNAQTTWINIPGDPEQNYLVRMEFIPNNGKLLIQQLNRKQNTSRLFIADGAKGKADLLKEETEKEWIDIVQSGNKYAVDFTNNFTWLPETNSILWVSEKDGWRHFYQVPFDGKPEKLITEGNFDANELKYIDPIGGVVYFMASPDNATQNYLYRTKINGKDT